MWLFSTLAEEFRSTHPDAAKRYDQNPPQNEDEAQRWATELDFPPPEPWHSVIPGLISVELGLRELEFVSESAANSEIGLPFWFYQSMQPLVASSCLERMEFVLKKLSRGRNPLLPPTDCSAFLAILQSVREQPLFEPLRHFAAHGPHLGIGRDGWLDAPSEWRAWELIALGGEDGADVIPAFLLGNDSGMIARRSGTIRALRDAISQAIEDAADGVLTVVTRESKPQH